MKPENTKLVTEFLSISVDPSYFFFYTSSIKLDNRFIKPYYNKSGYLYALHYDTDWNWLMSLVKEFTDLLRKHPEIIMDYDRENHKHLFYDDDKFFITGEIHEVYPEVIRVLQYCSDNDIKALKE